MSVEFCHLVRSVSQATSFIAQMKSYNVIKLIFHIRSLRKSGQTRNPQLISLYKHQHHLRHKKAPRYYLYSSATFL
jgi:hypothetical protein